MIKQPVFYGFYPLHPRAWGNDERVMYVINFWTDWINSPATYREERIYLHSN